MQLHEKMWLIIKVLPVIYFTAVCSAQEDSRKPSLKLLTKWLDVFEDEVLAFQCDIDGTSDWTFSWYRDGVKVMEDPDQDLTLDEEGAVLNITSASKSKEGSYTCQAHLESSSITTQMSDPAKVTVYDNIPTPTLHKDPDFNPMYAGEKVNFTCNVDVSTGWEYQWMKNGIDDESAARKSYSFLVGHNDQGKYSCKATRGERVATDSSEEKQLDVLESPVPALTKKTPWLDVFPEESVQLQCEMAGSSDWTFTWGKDGGDIQADDVVSFDSSGAVLTIKSASVAHAGQYTCRGHLKGRSVSSNSSTAITLTVYNKKPSVMLTQDPDFRVMFTGETVIYSCHLNVSSGWEYLWYRDEKPLLFSGKRQRFNPSPRHRGKYKCGAKRTGSQEFLTDLSPAVDLEVIGSKPKPVLTQQPDANKLYVGELVNLECRVEMGSDWEYMWYKDGALQPVNNSRVTIKASSSDSGTYTCIAMRKKTQFKTGFSKERTFIVSDIPIPSTKLNRPWRDVFPSESTELSCQMDGSSDWIHTWYKDNQKVQTGQSISFKDDAATLTIKSASSSHRGRYSCSAKLKSRSVYSNMSAGLTLSVYDTKPRVTLTQRPVYEVMHSGDLVSFSCHVNVSSGWQYEWFKGEKNTGRSGDNYTITSVETTHTGSYKCRVKRGQNTVFLSPQSQTVNLTVLERPQATITLLTGWSEVFSTDSLMLKCGVPDSLDTDWNYTWFRESKAINTSHSQKYAVTPQNDPEQSVYTCKGISTGRPSYSKYSEPLKTKNLLLKRRVLLSISGIIFFGIIAVFLGCIVLRVTRKPDDVDKPEEEDLFLKMVQSTGTDVPCPLVEFITDESLKASSKEADENGTISSETTPLPITTQEDQAVSSDSPDTTENNGGLVSFKQ